jgi:hypothetical protein
LLICDLEDNINYEKDELSIFQGRQNTEFVEMSTLTNDNLHILKRNIIETFVHKESQSKDILFEETEGFTKLNSKAERTINIMLLGEPRVGKTTFFGQFFDDRTDGNYFVTVGK